jgi:hypothetical protein
VPEVGRLREQVRNRGRACTQVLFLSKAELGFFLFLKIVTGWLVPSTAENPGCWKQVSYKAGNGAENTKEKSSSALWNQKYMPTDLTLGVNPKCKQDFNMVWSLFSSSIAGPDLLPFGKLVGPDVPPFSQHPPGIP